MSKTIHIVVVEDDLDICEVVQFNLEIENYKVKIYQDGNEALYYLLENPPDLIVLDLMLPGSSGFDITKTLRNQSNYPRVPILLLTALSEEQNIVKGLKLGADDYITKPFSPKELLMRIKALLKRQGKGQDVILKYLDLNINFTKKTLETSDTVENFTPKEYKILNSLYDANGRVLSRRQILSSVWGYDYNGDYRTVDVHIRRLRKKLKDKKELIVTVKGMGYRLNGDIE